MTIAFEKDLSHWNEYQNTLWGRLFYTIAHQNLSTHIPNKSCHILDVGCGNGRTGIEYEKQGYHVTLMDASEQMISEARKKALDAGVVDEIDFLCAEVSELQHILGNKTFDVILCHNIIAYLDDGPSAIKMICKYLKRNGILSLISMNRYSESYRQILQQHNPQAAQDMLDAKYYTSKLFDSPIKLYSAQEIINLIQAENCSVQNHYGIRCVNDYIFENDIKENPDFFARLEQLELAMRDQYPYYLLARFFHIIARKNHNSNIFS